MNPSIRSNPRNFEGRLWRWHSRRHVPVQMVYGTVQSHCVAYTPKQAWELFTTATKKTKAELMAEGYRVKRIELVPAWKRR